MKEHDNEFVAAMQQVSSRQEHESNKNDTSAERVLTAVATIVLICGIIATIIGLIAFFDNVHNPESLGISIAFLIGTLISWSVMKVIANISINLKEINKKIKEQNS